ncbi:hypothetical protein O181_130067 [Austropuccinia psidii MF-1]|uniref:Uncharacterized protein n=1 Tax=Austropuccinia psidii MF-1 TaxID=1389203 RepID=A0A9Q3L0G2_9BASI|nr:hypothetical protein [Austropuccinia psidii MF-1]
MEPERTNSEPLRLMRTCNPTILPSGFTPLRHKQISDHESPYFPIQDRIQERKRIIGQEKNFFKLEAKRVRSYDSQIFGPVARSTKKQQTAVITSDEASSPMIRNDISTQMKHNFVIPESNISNNCEPLRDDHIHKEFTRNI